MAQQSDRELVASARGGDVDSYTALCGRYYPALVAVAQAIMGDRHRAEDAAQEALAQACEKLAQLRRPERFGGWVATICRNKARDLLRREPGHGSLGDVDPIAAERDDDGIAVAVRRAIAELDPTAREAVYLRYYDEMSYERMSEVMGMSVQAINGRLRRAKKKIAEILRRDGVIEVKL